LEYELLEPISADPEPDPGRSIRQMVIRASGAGQSDDPETLVSIVTESPGSIASVTVDLRAVDRLNARGLQALERLAASAQVPTVIVQAPAGSLVWAELQSSHLIGDPRVVLQEVGRG
jgi:hypothetical protein